MCRTPPHFPFRLTAARLRITKLVRTAQVDSNSTRTDSYVAIRPDLEAQMQVNALKAAARNGCQQIIRPSREMGAGLKIASSSQMCRSGLHRARRRSRRFVLATLTRGAVRRFSMGFASAHAHTRARVRVEKRDRGGRKLSTAPITCSDIRTATASD